MMLCPVWVLRAYVDSTGSIHQSDQLFVCHGGPRKGCALSKQQLAHWIMDIINHAYQADGGYLGIPCDVIGIGHPVLKAQDGQDGLSKTYVTMVL